MIKLFTGKVVKEKSTSILFLVGNPKYTDVYDSMSLLLDGSYVTVPEQNAANIVDLIRTLYAEITSTVQVRVDNVPPGVKVTLKSACRREVPEEADTCYNIEIGSSVTFTAEITASKCLSEPKTVIISPVGLNQNFELAIETLCSCDCERPGNDGFIPNSPRCNGQGNDKCGVCECNDGFTGEACDCDLNSLISGDNEDNDIFARCKSVSPSTGEITVCSDRGVCECGTCFCSNSTTGAIYGQLCECDDFSCVRGQNDEICSGSGKCECGECECYPGWTGKDCGCTEAQDKCASPYNGEACSGNGNCECNLCRCKETSEGLFSGEFCELFPKEAKPCKILKECVECRAFGSGPKSTNEVSAEELKPDNIETCHSSCSSFNMMIKTVKQLGEITESSGQCQAENQEGCLFFYELTPNYGVKLHETAENLRQECPQTYALAISMGVFAALLVIGLVTILIYKCVLVIDYKRECAVFERQLKEAKYAANQTPNEMYRSPITKFENPMYGKNANS